MDKWFVRRDSETGWWHVCDRSGWISVGIFKEKEEAEDYCTLMNRQFLGNSIKAWA